MTKSHEKNSTISLVTPQAEQAHQEKLEKLRKRLAAGAASPIVEDFDPDQFLEELQQKYSTE